METKTNTKKKTWIQKRHKVVYMLLRKPVEIYTKLRYGLTVVPHEKKYGHRPYLILMNHQTAFDQFFVCFAFKNPIYFIATEDIFSLGWISKVLRWLVAPIPIKKQTTDINAVMNCIKIAREGGSICLAPEGNRTYDGRTVYMNPAIAPLAKKLKLPIAFFRIEDGYGVQPRWTEKLRKGKMRAYVSRVMEPEELANLTADELYEQIRKELWVDENRVTGEFRSKTQAEYLERCIYVCPECGLSEFESHGDLVTCKHCGLQVRYLPTKELEGVGKEFPFRFVGQWYDYQCDFVNKLDLGCYVEEPMYQEIANVSEVIVYKNKEPLKTDADISLYGDRIEIDEMVLPFEEISTVAVLGRNKANIYWGKRVLQLKGDKRFNALKYVNIYYRHKNIQKGDEYGKFLGL